MPELKPNTSSSGGAKRPCGKSNRAIPKPLLLVFKRLSQDGIAFCVMRDSDRLEEFHCGGEIDILVSKNQLNRLRKILTELGFISLPSQGYRPHLFFVAYDEDLDAWFKLDVVSDVYYGTPVHALRTSLADNCLARRQSNDVLSILSAEDELITLLLHCVIDKAEINEIRGKRLKALRVAVSEENYLNKLLEVYWPPTMIWDELAAMIDAEKWQALLETHQQVVDYLAGKDRLGTFGRTLTDRVVRKISKLLTGNRPRSMTVAILAPDGAGKSTLTKWFKQSFYFPVDVIYMGLYQKGRRELLFTRLPGMSLVWRIFLQWARYLLGRFHQLRRRLVLFDRYTYDALLMADDGLNHVKYIRRWLLAYTCPSPDLVLFLDAPGKTLYDRKGEHSVEMLEKQRLAYLNLRSKIPQLAVVDATRSPDSVRRQALRLIWRGYLAKQGGIRKFNES